MHPILQAVRALCIAVGAVAIIRLIGRSILLTLLGGRRDANPSGNWRDRVLLRYEKLRTSIWLFAWCKIRLDPMFDELPRLLEHFNSPKTILDLGCGYGIAGCTLLEWFPEATILGIDPAGGRVRAASEVFATRGRAVRGKAPDAIASFGAERFDAALLLDVIHFLTDEQLRVTLSSLRDGMPDGAVLAIRADVPHDARRSLRWKLETVTRVLTGGFACHRSQAALQRFIADAGFGLVHSELSGSGGELCWFIAKANSRS
jgi:SAM-dependent methyltransferase